jgi:hypothetical protein
LTGDQGLADRVRQRLAGDKAHHHAADQPRPGGRRDRIHIAERDSGVLQRGGDQRLQRLDVRARRDLGHDAAIGPVRRLLPRQPMREHAAVTGHQRRRGLVARGFEAQDQHGRALSVRPKLVEGRPTFDSHAGDRTAFVRKVAMKRAEPSVAGVMPPRHP